jgi:hypothetical protein
VADLKHHLLNWGFTKEIINVAGDGAGGASQQLETGEFEVSHGPHPMPIVATAPS